MWSREKAILYKEEVVFWLLEISVGAWKIFVCEGSEKVGIYWGFTIKGTISG